MSSEDKIHTDGDDEFPYIPSEPMSITEDYDRAFNGELIPDRFIVSRPGYPDRVFASRAEITAWMAR